MGTKNVVGQAVSGSDFFERPKEIKKLLKAIKSGSHILMSAPRRVGKTSLMYYLIDNAEDNYCFIYVITQSINNANDFYKKIFRLLVDADSVCDTTMRLTENTKAILTSAINRIKGFKVSGFGGIDLNEGQKPDYKVKLFNLLSRLDLDGQKLVLMVDEYTQTVENIRKDCGDREAMAFLQTNREMAQDRAISKNVQFIFTGSIGLENIVSRLNSVDLINDLHSHKVMPLSKDDSILLARSLLENMDFSMVDAEINYMLEKIEWFIPFYIQLFLSEIENLHIDEEFEVVSRETVDNSFDKMLEHRNHFEHWQKRLRGPCKKEEYDYAVEILNAISRNSVLSSNELFNLAVKKGMEEDFKDVLHILTYDGYINNNDDHTLYRFNSPILKAWWYKNVAN